MKNLIYLFLVFLVTVQISTAQNFLNAYTDQDLNGYTGFANRIATDQFNNVVNTTTFSGTLEIDGQTFGSQGAMGSIIIKRDDNGSVLWAKALTCGGTALIGGIYIDLQSNIYVSGMFGDTLASTTLDCQPYTIPNGPGMRVFIVKYAPNGTVLWCNSIPCSTSGASGNADLYRITGNGTNRIAVSAPFYYVGSQNVGPDVISTALGNVLIAQCDDNGNWLIGRVLNGNTNSHISLSLSMNAASELFIGGLFRGSMGLGAAGTLTTPPTELNDFIVKMDPNGFFEWGMNFPFSSWWRTEVMAYQNDVYLAGSFGSTATIGSTVLTAPFYSTYLAKIDNAGSVLWAKKYGDAETSMYCASLQHDVITICGYTTNSQSSNMFDTYNMIYANTLPMGITMNSIGYLIRTDLNGNVTNGACYGLNFPTLNTTGIASSPSKVYITGNAGSGARFGGHIINPTQINGSNYVAVYTDSTNIISGSSFYDMNSNGLFDAGDLSCAANLNLSDGNTTISSLIDGDYIIGVGTGTFTSSILNPPLYYTYSPLGYTSVFANLSSEIDSNRNFVFQPIANQSDLVIDLVTGFFRPGFNGMAYVTLSNIGTTTESGTINLLLNDTSVSIISSTPAATTMNGNAATFNYNLNPGETISFAIQYHVAVAALIGTAFQSSVNAINGNDLTPQNNSDVINSMITGSYDPNMKEVSDTIIDPSFVQNNEFLEYTIHFQNTGNDTAFTVILIDTLSNLIDLSSFSVISSSHPVVVNNYDGVYWFRFNHINLPDSNTNELASHGFVKYKVKLKNTVAIGSVVNNTAYIYFDFNSAIVTNTTSTVLSVISAINDVAVNSIAIFPNPVLDGMIQVKSNQAIQQIGIYDVTGRLVFEEQVKGLHTKQLDVSALDNGVYILKVNSIDSSFEQQLIKQ